MCRRGAIQTRQQISTEDIETLLVHLFRSHKHSIKVAQLIWAVSTNTLWTLVVLI
jgi:hypothetical protein